MRSSFFAVLLVTACTGPSGDDKEPVDTADADTDADTDTDTDADTDTEPAADRDEDGFTTVDDCDDTRADVNPDAPADVCNGRDDDCDGRIDEDPDLHWFLDTDGDGFGTGSSSFVACDPGSTVYAPNNLDCDDEDATIWPGADEPCDYVDNDCDEEVDEDLSQWQAFYRDADDDGAGTDEVVYGCDADSVGGVTNAWDCDDADRTSPVFVSPSGSTSGSGRVHAPVASIQRAINLGPSCVKVAAGTYVEDIDFNGRNLTVESLDGAAYTTIMGTGAAPVVTFRSGETADAVLRGFTITGGGGSQESSSSTYWDGTQYVYYYYSYAYGGGLYVYGASPTLQDLVVTENALPDSYGYWVGTTEYYYGSSSGGGLYSYGGSPTLTDVDFVANNASQGGAIYNAYDTLTGTRVRMFENTGDYGTVYSTYGATSLRNVVMDANTTNYGYAGLYVYEGTFRLQHGTLVGGEYGLYNYAADVSLDSTVIVGNATGLYDETTGAGTWSLAYNNVYANGGRNYVNVTDPGSASGNLSVSPGFDDFSDDADADNDTLTLTPGSLMIDAGNADRRDADGSRADIGAYGGPEGTWTR